MFPAIAGEVEDVGVGCAAILAAAVIDVRKDFYGNVFFVNDAAEDVLVSEE